MLHDVQVAVATDEADQPERAAQGTDTSAAQRLPRWHRSGASLPSAGLLAGSVEVQNGAYYGIFRGHAHDPPEFRDALQRRAQAYPRARQQRRQLGRHRQLMRDPRYDVPSPAIPFSWSAAWAALGSLAQRRAEYPPRQPCRASWLLTGRLAAVSPSIRRSVSRPRRQRRTTAPHQ